MLHNGFLFINICILIKKIIIIGIIIDCALLGRLGDNGILILLLGLLLSLKSFV
jgi:hypothetical protein